MDLLRNTITLWPTKNHACRDDWTSDGQSDGPW